MPRHRDLHGNAPDHSPVVLLLIDVINDFDYPGGRELLRCARPMFPRLAALKRRAKRAGVPVIYVNDNLGKWKSDFHKVVDHCCSPKARGREIVPLLRPDDDDYFVLKPKHSGFYGTTLDLLLRYVGARTLILTGLTGDNCVLFTANDAFLRDFDLLVVRDGVASIDPKENQHAIGQMQRLLKAKVFRSTEINFPSLKKTRGVVA